MDLYLQFPSFRPRGARSDIAWEWGYKRREDIDRCMQKIKKLGGGNARRKEGRKEGRKERRHEG